MQEVMNPFLLTAEEKKFRKDFRKWLKKELPPPQERKLWTSPDLELRYSSWRIWQKKLYAAGWMNVSWPKQLGGKEYSLVCEHILGQELALCGAPISANWISLAAIAQALLSFGTPQQKQKYLPSLANGDVSWCLGVTEPDAGSNVMATKSSGKIIGNEMLVNAHKIWSTHSPRADYCLMLVRSDETSKPEWGMTMVIIDLKSPEVTVKPLRQLHGEDNYGEIFVRNLKISLDQVVGRINGGWLVQASTWLAESIPPFDVALRIGLCDLLDTIRNPKYKKNVTRYEQEILQTISDAESVILTTVRALRSKNTSKFLPSLAPLIKIAFTESSQKITRLGLEISDFEEQSKWSGHRDNWLYRHVSARSNTIARAPTEIHKNFIASLLFGAPR